MNKPLILLLASLAFSSQGLAHVGHDEAPGTDGGATANQVTLSEAAIKNLGIDTVKATIAPHAPSIRLNALVGFLPEKRFIITPGTAGRVSEILAKIGEKVGKGQALLSIQPVTVGSSPVTLASPIDGVVVKQSVVGGQSVTTETAVMEVADPSQVLVRGTLYETPDVSRISVGQKVHVTSELLRDKESEGIVQRVDNAFDKESRTFNVYALIDNKEAKLLGNMQVAMAVEIGEPSEVLAIPAKAILGDNGEYFVFTRDGNNFERRSVMLGAEFGDLREVLEGVLPDEEVVTVGNYQLQFAKPSAAKEQSEHKD